MDEIEIITIAEACNRFSLPKRQLYTAIKKGKIHAYQNPIKGRVLKTQELIEVLNKIEEPKKRKPGSGFYKKRKVVTIPNDGIKLTVESIPPSSPLPDTSSQA